MKNEVYIFFIYILSGFLIGIVFDFFRVIRKILKANDFITLIEDALFWIFTGMLVIYVTFKFNNGNLRLYTFMGIIIGVILYMITFSKILIKILITIVNFIKIIIKKVLIVPIKFIYKILKKITDYTIRNFRNIVSKTVRKSPKFNKRNKKVQILKE